MGISHRRQGLLHFSGNLGPADEDYDLLVDLTHRVKSYEAKQREDPADLSIKQVTYLWYREKEDSAPDVPHKHPRSG